MLALAGRGDKNRSMRKRKAIPNRIRERVFAIKGTLCFYCKVNLMTLDNRNRTLDHRLAHRNRGADTVENLVPCCRSCNSMRHTMGDEEFTEYLGLKKKGLSRFQLFKARKKLKEKYDLIFSV